MRITNSMMIANTVRNINNAARRLSEAQDTMSSQKKIQLASDDPVVATRAIKYRNYVSTVEQYQKNVDDVTSWQEVTETALSDLSDVVQQVRELTVKASSDTMTAEDLAEIKLQITELRDEAIQIMNTSYAGRYVFGGYSTGEEPYKLTATMAAGTAATNTTGYADDGSDITDIFGLSAGAYTLTTVANGSNFDITLSDAEGNVVAKATNADAAAGVTLTGADGTEISLAASTSISEGTMTFDVTEAIGDTVTFKGQYLSLGGVVAEDTDDSAIIAFCETNAEYNTSEAQSIKYNIGFNTDITVNIEGQDVIGQGGSNLFDTLSKLILVLDGQTSYKTAEVDDNGTVAVNTTALDDIDDLLTDLDNDYDRVLTAQATLGARMDYVSRVSDRLSTDYETYTELKSNNEDVDVSVASTEVSTAEYVYEASLSVGAKVITKTLIDYMA